MVNEKIFSELMTSPSAWALLCVLCKLQNVSVLKMLNYMEYGDPATHLHFSIIIVSMLACNAYTMV